MHIAEVVTIAKSLPLLRLNTYKSLILSYSADYRRIFRKNTTQRCGDFFENRRLDLLFPKPAAIPLHLHDNGWCQKERPCGGKKIRAANENRNFTEVFGLCDKNGTASCGYKSQPLSARQTKKSPWQYSLEVFQGIPPRIFLAVP